MSDFKFPPPDEDRVITTGMMGEAERRTLRVQRTNPIVIWSGRSRIGKTTTAEWIVDRAEEAHEEDNPGSFDAKHYEVGEISSQVDQAGKVAVRGLHHAIVGKLDEGLYRSSTVQDLTGLTLKALKRLQIGLLFVDEAGLLSLDAIRGLVGVLNRATKEGHNLGLILIGMDDLPHKIDAIPQVSGRVQEWIFFKGYDDKEILQLLGELHLPYREADLGERRIQEHIEFIAETQDRLPGQIVPFMHRMKGRLENQSEIPDIRVLRAVHLITQRDKEQAKNAADARYQHKKQGDPGRRENED